MTDLNKIFAFNNYEGGVRWLDKGISVNERRNINTNKK